ncbi:MAG: hypothetical protein A2Y33_00560 [Spirochaetes bacterium GWF1_51_8]|nr:MAG: hypothetical protein A2Y33_00560 [Spirochaetes bacterium GWF1_51_8]
MNSTKNPNEILAKLLDQCISMTGASSGSIMLREKDSPDLKIVLFRNLDANVVQKTNIKVGDGVTGFVVQEGRPKLVNDVDLEPKYIPVRSDIKSELAVPLTIHGFIRGVLNVDSDHKNAFSEDDIDLMQTVAHQAAQIITRTMLTSELERKIQLQQILIDISNEVEKVYELKTAFDFVMKRLADKLKIQRGMLVLFDNEDVNQLSVVTAYNLTEEEMSRGIYRVGEGIIGRVVSEKTPISVPDINKNKDFLNKMKVKREKNTEISFIAIPIKIEGYISGVLAVEKEFEGTESLNDETDIIYLIGKFIANKVRAFQRITEEKQTLLDENLQLKKELYKNYGLSNFIGKNSKMVEVFDLVKLVADSQSSILIIGESGTGKELVAKSLHYNSGRREQPYISVNCAAIPENLLESELFGYKKGAFTGATVDRKGKFILANKGTIFLDEIGDMPIPLQGKLLRVIQEREVEPIGSESKVKIDIRIVSATNKNLQALIKEGKFREDLFYRLNVIEVKIPPLRDRKDDIPLLVTHFKQKYAVQNNRKIDNISPEAMRILQAYAWPGNVRELENTIERAVLLCKSGVIEPSSLPGFLVESEHSHVSDLSIGKWIETYIKNSSYEGKVYDTIVGYIEKELITSALLFNNRNKVKTADFLGINRNTLRFKMRDYGIK